MTTTQTQTRDHSSGRYSFQNKWERVCARCGLTLGVHTAEAPHTVDDNFRNLGIDKDGHAECPGFKPERKR